MCSTPWLKHSVDGEYLYFRTDHHWTALGAYYAYEQFCTDSGQTPVALDQFKEVKYDNFQGSFYRDTKSAALGEHPDTVCAYIPPSTNDITITDDKNSTWVGCCHRCELLGLQLQVQHLYRRR